MGMWRARWLTVDADHSAQAGREPRVRAGSSTADAIDQIRGISRRRQGSQQVGVQHHLRWTWTVSRPPAKNSQRTGEQPILGRGGLPIHRDQVIGGLDHDLCSREEPIVLTQWRGIWVKAFHLSDDVEVSSLHQLQIDEVERVQPGPELAGGASDTSGHCANLAVFPRQHGDNAIGLTQLVCAQDDSLIAVGGHDPHCLPVTVCNRKCSAQNSHAWPFRVSADSEHAPTQ